MTPHHPPRWRVKLVRETPAPSFPTASLRTSRDVWQAFRFLSQRDREEFWIAALDGKNRLIGTHCVSVGTLTASLVHPRETAKVLVLASAAAFLCVHVHPSGDPTPSAEDTAITERLRQCGELLGISLLDHVIIGAERYYSFADEGQLGAAGKLADRGL
jgi:DNA repair protein RadC